eukprot:TRINITY_DN70188_c0_g1_i1.p1 TRINITY_DN70188_c0_g1~~TRINITY_DN70188_c0_g1_i1.p1  ORF type:complete len:115 (+),score=6.67 TRINITY_DN70188_c0_g1_i1:204-548(+)
MFINTADKRSAASPTRPATGDSRVRATLQSNHLTGRSLSSLEPAGRSCSYLQPTSTIGRLVSRVDTTTLRAVAVTKVLSGFGTHLRSNAAGTAMDYELSRTVNEIDYFLSHDWA